MKRITRYLITILVLSLLVSTVPAAFAAEYKAEPGKTAKVVFEVKNIAGIDGAITVSDSSGIVDSSKIEKIEASGLVNNINGNTFFSFGTDPVTWKLTYSVKLKAGAANGATCTVTANYSVTDKDYNLVEGLSQSHTVVVNVPQPTEPQPTEPQPTEPKPTEPQPTEPKPTEPQPTQPQPTEPKPTEPKPTQPQPGTSTSVDTAKLQKLVNEAKNLNSSDYTADSWANLQSVLKTGESALKKKDQAAIDAAVAALEKAVNSLVALNNTTLEEAIQNAEKFLNENAVGAKVKELMDALASAKELLNSQDQAKKDEAAALLNELQKAITDMIKDGETIKEVEKIVEVPPKDPYCNISIHHVWPILFFISLALNAGFIALIVIYFVRKKKNQTDDTPLVDYDIADDVADE